MIIENDNLIMPNRIITMPIQCGFQRKEPQVEEVKDLWGFLKSYFETKKMSPR